MADEPTVAAGESVVSGDGDGDGYGDGDGGATTVLDTLGEDIVRIVSPVSACMLLVTLLVSLVSSPTSPLSITTTNTTTSSPSSTWSDITSAAASAAVFVAAVTAVTFLMALLFYLRCTAFLRYYLAFSSVAVLLFLGGEVFLLLLSRLRLPIDAASFAALLLNFAAVGAAAVLRPAFVPIAVNQGYLVVIGVLTAYWFTLLPEWTTWALLVAMAVYDLAAVLLPWGPLRVLVELAISRNEEIPALVYEARPVDPRPGEQWRLWREGRDLGDNSTAESSVAEGLERERRGFDADLGANSAISRGIGRERRGFDANLGDNSSISALSQLMDVARRDSDTNEGANSDNSVLQEAAAAVMPRERRGFDAGPDANSNNSAARVVSPPPLETRVVVSEEGSLVSEVRVPLIQPCPERGGEEEHANDEGIGLSSSGAIKLGLGDFIFYSVLVGRAAMYDFMTVYACYLAVIAGLGITLLLLTFFRKALPALPVSITLGVVFYVLTRALLEDFVVQCSTNLLMF